MSIETGPTAMATHLWGFSFCKVKRGSYRVGDGTREALSTEYLHYRTTYQLGMLWVSNQTRFRITRRQSSGWCMKSARQGGEHLRMQILGVDFFFLLLPETIWKKRFSLRIQVSIVLPLKEVSTSYKLC